jgi:hypothetical protein
MLAKIRGKLVIKRSKTSSPNGKGQSLVEMAIITPLLLLLFLGVLEVGWAIRGYVVLLNADREATRFAARGRYLDFSQTERENIGYDYVLDHTMDSLSQQLAFDVMSDDPNGTMIISHFLVDTGKPCADPPCNDDCEADKHNKHGGCDCTTPDRREPDYPYDDLVLYPGTAGYDHFTTLYGINRTSRLDNAQLIAELKEQNDAFNCALNREDPSAVWSANSVVVVEAYYDQPQLLGVPIISNRFTDPVPIYVQTAMRISADRGSAGGEAQGAGCPLLPIVVHQSTIEDMNEGESTGNIRNGTGYGNFGWLRWTDDTEAISSNPNSEEYLAEELANPRLAMNDYQEPDGYDPVGEDTVINADDNVWGLTGNVNSNGVAKEELTRLMNEGQSHLLPIWDEAYDTGSNVVYHIVGFAWFKIDGFDLTGNPKEISATFMGWDNGTCRGNGH